MIFGLPSVASRPAPNMRQPDWPAGRAGSASSRTVAGARDIFHARYSRYATPTYRSTRNTVPNVCASIASPLTALVSHSASPIHIAARNGSTSRMP